MKALFIGLGSAGRRHLRLLMELEPSAEVAALRSGAGMAGVPELAACSGRSLSQWDEALDWKPDFAVIANPTSLHLDAATKLAQAGVPFLLEKPVAAAQDGLDELAELARAKSLPVLVGLQLRHHPAYAQLQAWLAEGALGRPLSLSASVGQWLPDWRPGADYRASQTARPELGGGVVLELVHELDLALALMGPAKSVSCATGNFSSLEMAAEDLAEIVCTHQPPALSRVHLDCIRRGYYRSLEIFGEQGEAVWDYGQGWLELRRPGQDTVRIEDPPDWERDQMFRKQMAHWLTVLAGQEEPAVGLDQGIAATRLALAAKRAAQEQRTVEL
ncbi:MAG: Gfo/Idh/MocA family oxidoreductase [Desulfarculaceae bacterium]|nr:Gfo/Idh/MocA family oxidoreductase [Desulfarculaceae bacterium]MCF8072928.1 Gfo/Idh/MocA family oxidoreductase [Desulfarculaceae bacterium]MCF8101096.1 Gfo/Idh/MocA family oxidoreductase [Desulfarculaceae bacterium]MCF8115517.1 Gfo/Idh/MocA family oxidoreductase [Desulfarculaceae bacterium]